MPTERTIYEFASRGDQAVIASINAQGAAFAKADLSAKKYFGTLTKGNTARASRTALSGAGTSGLLAAQTRELRLMSAQLPATARDFDTLALSVNRTSTSLLVMARNARAARLSLDHLTAARVRASVTNNFSSGGNVGANLLPGRGPRRLGAGVLGMGAGALVGVGVTALLVSGEESYRRAERAAGLYAKSQNEVNDAISRMRQVSVRGFQPLDEITKRYQRLGVIQEQLGADPNQVFTLLGAAADAERLQGGRTASTSAGVNQLIQGLTSGRLGGDELRSLRENLPRLANAIAKGLSEIRGEKIGIGDLRDLSARGLLTSTDAANSLLNQANELRRQAGALDPLLGESYQNLKTQFNLLNQDLGKLVGPSGLLSQLVNNLAESVNGLRGLLPKEDGPAHAITNTETAKAIGVALFSIPNKGLDRGLRGLLQDAVGEVIKERAQTSKITLSDPGQIDPGLGNKFKFRDADLSRATDDLKKFLTGFDSATESINTFSLNLANSGREFAQQAARRERFDSVIDKGLGGKRRSGKVTRALDAAFQDREQARFSRKNAAFQFDLQEQIDGGKRLLELRRELVGVTEQERAAKEALFSLEEHARRAGVGLLEEQKKGVQELASASQRQTEVQDLSLEFARAGTGLFRDLRNDISDLDGALINLGQRFADIILEVALFQPLTQALTGFFNPAASLLTPSASGNVFQNGGVTPFARGGIIGAPIAFPLNSGVGIAGEAGPEAIVPLKRDGQGNLGVGSSGDGGGIAQVGYLTAATLRKGLSDPEVVEVIARQVNKPGSALNLAVRGQAR